MRAVTGILTPTMAARGILKLMMSGRILGPHQISKELDIAPQTARNHVVHLRGTGLLKRVGYGKYQITDLGKEVFKQIQSQPSNDQSSRRESQ